MRLRLIGILILAAAALSACSSNHSDKPPYAGVKIGKPYEIYGRWYRPRYEPGYDETGVASWYGPGFHGNKTANGEYFDQNEMTAAHRTLPLPSIVRVTNLDNGKTTIVKINDRGPFKKERIIDLARGSANALGVTGTAKVRVQFLEQETKDYVQDSNSQGIHYAMNKLRGVNPEAASETQIASTKPAFYVMKVPTGHTPPPQAVAVSDLEAQQYPTRNIFEVVDHVEPQMAGVSVNESVLTTLEDRTALGKKYYVQAGIFGQKENARRLAQRIGAQNAKIVNTLLGDDTHFRVLVGPYKQADSAKNMLSKLASLGIPDARIVRD